MMMMRSGGRKMRDFQNATQLDDERVVKEKRKEIGIARYLIR
jgi:hypothetical protein